jgi:hypothetical protein
MNKHVEVVAVDFGRPVDVKWLEAFQMLRFEACLRLDSQASIPETLKRRIGLCRRIGAIRLAGAASGEAEVATDLGVAVSDIETFAAANDDIYAGMAKWQALVARRKLDGPEVHRLAVQAYRQDTSLMEIGRLMPRVIEVCGAGEPQPPKPGPPDPR